MNRVDQDGHFDFLLDLIFIAYDIYQITQEGWTPTNTAALTADIACAFVPLGTGSGPAVRAAMAGGDVALTYARTASHVPGVIRAGQTAEKAFQFIEGSDSSGPNLSDADGSSTLNNLNSVGDPDPQIIDPRTGQPIIAPPNHLKWIPEEQRVSWGRFERADFIREWYDRGYSTPEGGWDLYDIHHIIPREYGGTNAFENLVPVVRDVHQQQLNPWWFNYK